MELNEEEQCKCGDEPAAEGHSCPYAEDIHGADPNEIHCTCCSHCTYQCAMDI